MKTRTNLILFPLASALLVIAVCILAFTNAAWAANESTDLTADAGSALTQAEGQNGILANSWRFQDGVPLDRLEVSDEDTMLSIQSEIDVQSSNNKIFGVDVSEWEYSIDWNQAAKSIKFAIIRCGYGDDYSSQDDKYWLANVRGCQAAGVPMGVYIYSYATNTAMARSEALHVVRCIKEAGLTEASLALPIYLDMEDNSTLGSDFVAIFETFRSTMAANGYTNVGIYANCNWWRNYLSGIQLDSSLRWVAHWGTDDPFSGYEDLRAKGYGVWQYGGASVAGIPVETDANYLDDNAPFLKEGAMYRLYNPYSGEHLYTASLNERTTLASIGWIYEGIGWYTPKSSSTPVYRLYNPYSGDHHYTTSENERDTLVGIGWNAEGIGWYSDDSKGAALHRLYNPWLEVGTHHYTTSTNERDELVRLGWYSEGIAWYGIA